MVRGVTLTQHILEGQKAHPGATGEFTALLTQVALSGKQISFELAQAGLLGNTGLTGATNVQGEQVKKLDDIANTIFVECFKYLDLVSLVVSEEMNTAAALQGQSSTGKYNLYIDPMDGSSNIDVNGGVGSIFSIHRVKDAALGATEENLLHKGTAQVTAGYIMYGPCTMLVLACCGGVHGFTLDTGIGEFVLTHPNIRIPKKGKNVSVNAANYPKWSPGLKAYLDFVEGRGAQKESFTYRYSGTFVTDMHRILLEGGVFLYPPDSSNPQGKLRLLYEVAPMAMVAEAAGGVAMTTGHERILNIQPTHIHQRVPAILGSPDNVHQVLQFLQK